MSVILHISDLHFGMDRSPQETANRIVVLNALLDKLRLVDKEWWPSLVCISGDLGWQGDIQDYAELEVWLGKLLERVELSWKDVVACPGNHDMNRVVAETTLPPSSPDQADKVLQVPLANHLCAPFSAFEDFLDRVGVPRLLLWEKENYLAGTRMIGNLRLVVLNSAWACRGGGDRGSLWLGLPQLRVLEAHNGLELIDASGRKTITVALVHHPFEWYAEPDGKTPGFGDRPAAWEYLAKRTNVILCGHTHSGFQSIDRIAGTALLSVGGASYGASNYYNNFKLLRLGTEAIEHRFCEFNPRAASVGWEWVGGIGSQRLNAESSAGAFRAQTRSAGVVQRLILAVALHAKLFLDQKSKQLQPSGDLPKLLRRNVFLASEPRTSAEVQIVTPGNPDTEQITMREAIRYSRRCIVLGDLGSGKSTLVGQFVTDISAEQVGRLSILISLKNLNFSPSAGSRQFLADLSKYFWDHVGPAEPTVALADLLEEGNELVFVFDGLDEAPAQIRADIFSAIEHLTHVWSGIHVVVTSRNLETIGLSLNGWQELRVAPLAETEMVELFRNQALAEGENATQSMAAARSLVEGLRSRPRLRSVVTTPLFARLMYGARENILGLADDLSDQPTLGNLLHDFLLERLGVWGARDGRRTVGGQFESVCNTPASRASLLGFLARRMLGSERTTRVQATEQLRIHSSAAACHGDPRGFAEEALAFFVEAGVVLAEPVVDSPVRPLIEMAAAFDLVDRWETGNDEVEPQEFWRIVGFAAAICRIRGIAETYREKFEGYLETLLGETKQFPMACGIVAEAQDASLARFVLTRSREFDRQPLPVLWDALPESTSAIAQTIVLAGDTGFEWLWREYLDPRMPIQHLGSSAITRLVKDWAVAAYGHLSHEQECKLSGLVEPLMAAQPIATLGFLESLALLIPDRFKPNDRLWFQSNWLQTPEMRTAATGLMKDAWEQGHRGIVEAVLERRAGDEPQAAALLFELTGQSCSQPNHARYLLRNCVRERPGNPAPQAIKDIEKAIGGDRWVSFLRWSLGDSDKNIAAAAGIILARDKRGSLVSLGTALFGGLHDGGRVAGAEEALDELVKEAGRKGVRWLVDEMTQYRDSSMGAHSGCWRILLRHIDAAEEEGPELLSRCMTKVGTFTLARYGNVRLLLKNVLIGVERSEYRGFLRELLRHHDPVLRHGAAMVLCVVSPADEADALVTAVKFRARGRLEPWHEWEEYMMTLSFGPGPMVVLRRNLGLFPTKSRPLALALLHRNGTELSQDERSELILALANPLNYYLLLEDGGQLLSTGDAKESLLGRLGPPLDKDSPDVALALLKYHSATLGDSEFVRCIASLSPAQAVSRLLGQDRDRLEGDRRFRQQILEACGEFSPEGDCATLVQKLITAIDEPEAWKDVLWELFVNWGGACVDQGEASGMALLIFGKKWPGIGEAIGQAARLVMADPRFDQTRFIDSLHWVGLLADEFAGLTEDERIHILIAGSAISNTATYSLIARLGRVPEGFPRRARQNRLPPDGPSSPLFDQEPVTSLTDIARDSEDLHPKSCFEMERTIWLGTDVKVGASDLSNLGEKGAMLATILAFCCGRSPKANGILTYVSPFTVPKQQNSHHCANRLRILYRIARAVLLERDSCRAEYFEYLDQALKLRDNFGRREIALELLRVRGFLKPGQVSGTFETIAGCKGMWAIDLQLASHMARWLKDDLDPETETAVMNGAQRAIDLLDQDEWNLESGYTLDPVMYLEIPLIWWRFGGVVTVESASVFLKGLKLAISSRSLDCPDNRQHPVVCRVEAVFPLVKRIETKVLADVMKQGVEHQDNVVAFWARLVNRGN